MMMKKTFGRVFLVLPFLGLLPLAAFADEVVHFTNGAEMTVRSHAIETEKDMVRLDLGGNSFIAFPMSMVDKIVSAGQNVFLNPGFYPSNQAIAGSQVSISDTTIRGAGDPVGLVPRPNGKGGAGVMLGEAADVIPDGSNFGPRVDQAVANSRRRFNPLYPAQPGGAPQVIMPPGMTRGPVQLTLLGSRPVEPTPPPPPANSGPQENPPAEDPPAEDPSETP